MTYELHNGDCLDLLRGMPTASADSLVSDPPGALSFMGMAWDGDKGGRGQWVAWLAERMREARRVVKPGHYGLVWALPRTSHWTALALEDAGWEIRDCISHYYSISEEMQAFLETLTAVQQDAFTRVLESQGTPRVQQVFGSGFPKHKSALKPAVEDWWLVRNPGKGGPALNIDAARVEGSMDGTWGSKQLSSIGYGGTEIMEYRTQQHPAGRWPAHLVLSHSADCNGVCAPGCAVALMDTQSGERKSGANKEGSLQGRGVGGIYADYKGFAGKEYAASTGGASRFFTRLDAGEYDPFIYAAKASRAERNRGCEGLEAKEARDHNILTSGYRTDPRSPNGGYENKPAPPRANHHPTVKSQALMQWLCRLITPPGGVVLDPFCGSASTGVAAAALGMRFIGCEYEAEYIPIARARLEAAYAPLAHMEIAT